MAGLLSVKLVSHILPRSAVLSLGGPATLRFDCWKVQPLDRSPGFASLNWRSLVARQAMKSTTVIVAEPGCLCPGSARPVRQVLDDPRLGGDPPSGIDVDPPGHSQGRLV